jgi:DNA-binding CsgD family transcriptional regulator
VSELPAESNVSVELDAAVERVGEDDLAAALDEVARKLPVPAGVETVAIRIRDSDAEGDLHLVASEGTPANDRRNPLFYTQSMAQARALFVLRSRHSLARALGFTWLQGHWIKHCGEPLGAITVGSRTERRPTPGQIAIVDEVAARLGAPIQAADRRKTSLEAIARSVARSSLPAPVEAPARVAKLLRPRELTVLALYSEGLSALEIADAFVISPHTVRTHIKNAYRRLGVHSREEAARLIHAERLLELV